MTLALAVLIGFGVCTVLGGAGLLTQRIAPRLKLRARDDREPTEFEDCLFSPLPTAERDEGRGPA